MPKKPASRPEHAMFNVVYEDGSQRSNRKVSGSAFGGAEGEAEARTIIEQQDRDIAAKSGVPATPIKSVNRVRR